MHISKRLSLTVLSLLLCFGLHAQSQSQGPNNPSAAIASGQGANMPGLSNLFTAGGYTAYADLAAYPNCIGPILCYHSPLITISGFGFNIPSNAQIDGIQVEILKFVSQPVTTIHDSIVQLAKGGVPVGLNLKSSNQWQMTGSSNYEVYGDSTNLWDTTWTPAEINAPGFGLILQLSNGNIDQTAQIDHVRMTVYYTLTTGTENNIDTPSLLFYQQNNLLLCKSEENKIPEQLEIYDTSGRLIWENKNYDGQAIDTKEMTKDMYIISYKLNNLKFTQKIQVK